MNAILFKDKESSLFIPDSDPKAVHIKDVIKPKNGDEIYAGIINGSLFKAKIHKEQDGYRLSEERTPLPNPKILDIHLCVAFARPQIAKRILFEAACFGVRKLTFYPASKGEAAYAQSSLYKNNEFKEFLIKGAEQACAANIPMFSISKNLEETIKNIDLNSLKLAPDLYEATTPFDQKIVKNIPKTLVFGSERGFSDCDRKLLRQNQFILTSLGQRALRTDTAIIAALGILAVKDI